MKKIMKAYLVIMILGILLLYIVTQFFGAGYVYLYFAHWELQTNIWMLSALVFMICFCIQTIFIFIKKARIQRNFRAQKAPSFSALHPYEKLAVLWLLNAQTEKEQMVSQIFAQSGMLKHIITASLLYKQKKYTEGHAEIEQVPQDAYELKEILYIDALLDQSEQEKSFRHLEALSRHQPSAWLVDVIQGYEQAISKLWGKFALKFPWAYLNTTHYGRLSAQDNTAWLTAILQRFDSSDIQQKNALKERYISLEKVYIDDTIRENKILWLKVLARCEGVVNEYERLVSHLLYEQFDQDVCLMWFEQKIQIQPVDYASIEQQVNIWQDKYTDAPIFSFVKWYIYQATGRYLEASQLLNTFPDHVLMNYLRIKSKIQDDPILLNQLNQVFESNTRFLKIQI